MHFKGISSRPGRDVGAVMHTSGQTRNKQNHTLERERCTEFLGGACRVPEDGVNRSRLCFLLREEDRIRFCHQQYETLTCCSTSYLNLPRRQTQRHNLYKMSSDRVLGSFCAAPSRSNHRHVNEERLRVHIEVGLASLAVWKVCSGV